ncbi:MAG: hypothetical protein IPN95_19570 [Bacteroidetes bacterium]|nr:hypothetical protein [Bacteroidota bacterium]
MELDIFQIRQDRIDELGGKPDVVFLDYSSDHEWLDVLKLIKEQSPAIRWCCFPV